VTAVTANQLGRLSGSACSGFSSDVFNALPPAAVSGISVECVSNLSIIVFANIKNSTFAALPCAGLTAPQIHVLPPAALQSITPECFRNLSAAAFGGITGNQIDQLPNSVISLLTPAQVSVIPGDVIANMTLNQLTALVPAAVQNLTGDQLGNLTVSKTSSFINLFNSSILEPNRNASDAFVRKVPASVPQLTNYTLIPAEQQQLTWLKVAVMDETYTPTQIPQEFVRYLPDNAVAGLRPYHIQRLTQEAVQSIGPNKTQYLGLPAFSAFTGATVALLTPSAFGSLNAQLLNNMTPEQLGNATAAQFAALPAAAFQNCTLSKALSSDQKASLSGDASSNVKACGASAPDAPNKLGGGVIALIVLGVLAAVALVAAAVYYFVRRNRASYQAI